MYCGFEVVLESFGKMGIMEGVWNWCTHRIVTILGSAMARYVGNPGWGSI